MSTQLKQDGKQPISQPGVLAALTWLSPSAALLWTNGGTVWIFLLFKKKTTYSSCHDYGD